nr:hypothetical protein [uncultured Allomuricauda sp.]
MFKITISFLCLTLSWLNAQETFHVLHVEGTILYDTITKPLEMGDEIVGNPKLKFSSENDRAVLLSNLRGRLILSSLQRADEKISEIEYYFKNNILPVKEYTATRGVTKGVIHLFFEDSSLYLPKKIKAFTIPKNDDSYYMLEYFIHEKRYQTKLKIIDDGFIELNSNVFFPDNDSLDIDELSKVNLKYYTKEDNQLIDINSIIFKWHEIGHISKELLFLKDRLKKKNLNEKSINQELTNFLRYSYGTDLKLQDFDVQ